jgi:hypothetical protein
MAVLLCRTQGRTGEDEQGVVLGGEDLREETRRAVVVGHRRFIARVEEDRPLNSGRI